MSETRKRRVFRELHERRGCFVIPNPWDAGTARLLAGLDFEALATTSAGLAFALGRPDAENAVSRDEALANAREIVEATDLPVSADLESGFADGPEGVAETIRLAAETGLAGGSIEDATGAPDAPIFELDRAVERVRAAVEAARAHDLVLTARAENFLYGRPDLADTIARLQAYQEAGADVLYAPGLTRAEDIATLVRELDRPVNVIMGLKGATLTVAELEALGVKRISVGSALARAALGAFLRAGREIRDRGTFAFAADAAPMAELNEAFRGGGSS